MLLLSEKVKVLDIRKEEKSYAEVAKTYGNKESCICETVKKEKEICSSFALTLQSAKVMATVHSKHLGWKRHYICTIRYFERKRPHSQNFYYSILL